MCANARCNRTEARFISCHHPRLIRRWSFRLHKAVHKTDQSNRGSLSLNTVPNARMKLRHKQTEATADKLPQSTAQLWLLHIICILLLLEEKSRVKFNQLRNLNKTRSMCIWESEINKWYRDSGVIARHLNSRWMRSDSHFHRRVKLYSIRISLIHEIFLAWSLLSHTLNTFN